MKLKRTRLSGLLRRALFATSASVALFFGPWLATVHAGTFGTVVSIGGHASDIALDEPRGLLYNANRVDIMSLADNKLKGSFQVSQQPSSLSVSPNRNYLVIAHNGNFASGAQANSLTAIALNAGNAKQTYALADPPPLGPRVVSVSGDRSYYTAGWGLFAASGILIAQFAEAAGRLNVGSHAINSSAGLIYAQIPDGTAQSQAAPPTVPTTPPAPQGSIVAPSSLTIVDADNLALREKLPSGDGFNVQITIDQGGAKTTLSVRVVK